MMLKIINRGLDVKKSLEQCSILAYFFFYNLISSFSSIKQRLNYSGGF